MEFQYEYAGKSYPVWIKKDGDGYKVEVEDAAFIVTSKEVKPGHFVLKINGNAVKLSMATEGSHRHIFFDGEVFKFTRAEGRKKKAGSYNGLAPEITSPISGKVVKVDVEEGMMVEDGQTLLTIEAMKMEYQIKAPYAGKVEEWGFKQGDQVEIGMVLVKMKKTEGE